MAATDHIVQHYVEGLATARDGFLALRAELQTNHPEWQDGKDARLNVLAKPANLIITAIVNLRVTQHVAVKPTFWSSLIAPEFNTELLIAGPLYELQTFYRFGFFQFLMSSVEHGLRAIQPIVVNGIDAQADQEYGRVYKSLFNVALASDVAARHINLLSFLSAVRNTIHNNGFYYPPKHTDAEYHVGGKSYILRDTERIDFLSWDSFIAWLPLICDALNDLLHAPIVVVPTHISDLASFPLPVGETLSPSA